MERPQKTIKRQHTTYELWWEGADKKWRRCHEATWFDRATEQARRFIDEYPGVRCAITKTVTLRDTRFLWEANKHKGQVTYPEITKYEQIEITGTHKRSEDSQGSGSVDDVSEPAEPVHSSEAGELALGQGGVPVAAEKQTRRRHATSKK